MKRIPKELQHVRKMIFAIKKKRTWKATQNFVDSLYNKRVKKGIRLSKLQYKRLWDCYRQWVTKEPRRRDYDDYEDVTGGA